MSICSLTETKQRVTIFFYLFLCYENFSFMFASPLSLNSVSCYVNAFSSISSHSDEVSKTNNKSRSFHIQEMCDLIMPYIFLWAFITHIWQVTSVVKETPPGFWASNKWHKFLQWKKPTEFKYPSPALTGKVLLFLILKWEVIKIEKECELCSFSFVYLPPFLSQASSDGFALFQSS